jgi:hypothetical protein
MNGQKVDSGGSEDKPMQADTQPEKAPQRPAENGEAERDEWVAAVEQIVSDAEAWATEQHWFVHRGPKTITESGIGTYEVPTLLIQAPAGRFIIDPIARYVIGALGEVDFCVHPSYYYVMIVRTDAGWQFETNPKTSSRPWSKTTFFEVVSELAKQA